MNPIRNFFDRIKPIAEKNKYLHTTYDAFETFLFTPDHVTSNGAHIRDGMDLKRLMVHVVLAMQLALVHGTINIGHQHYAALGMFPGFFDGFGLKLAYGFLQLLPLIIVVHVVGLGIEFVYAALRGHGVEEGFLVSGMLIPLIMPPDIPLWIVAVSVAFAVIIGKEAFGGTGMNILNIALLSRVFVFFAYPTTISGDVCWVAYDYNFLHNLFGVDGASAKFLAANGVEFASLINDKGVFDPNRSPLVDGWTGATPLALAAKGGWEAVTAEYSLKQLIWGGIPGSIGEMNKPFIAFGAVMLVGLGIASWRIMISLIMGAVVMGLILNAVAPAFPNNAFLAVPWYYHFIMGSLLFAMAFMATDPVTASGTATGKWIYGFSIGFLGILIRVLNPAYPEGWMLAILFMNVFAPTIDHYVIQSNIKRRLASG